MGPASFPLLISLTCLYRVQGHGNTIRPVPRFKPDKAYQPWSVGAHVSSNPSGKAHRDARLPEPCAGTNRGDQPFPMEQMSQQITMSDYPAPTAYIAGHPFQSAVHLNADHGGDARWDLCPHSEPSDTEECFDQYVAQDWEDVHKGFGSKTEDHAYSGESAAYPVTLPANMPAGKATLRWIWICKYTDEIFVSCADVDIQAGSSGNPNPAPTPEAGPSGNPNPAPTPEAGPSGNPNPAPTADSLVSEAKQQVAHTTAALAAFILTAIFLRLEQLSW